MTSIYYPFTGTTGYKKQLQLPGDSGIQLVSAMSIWVAIVLSLVLLLLIVGVIIGVLQSQSQCTTPGVIVCFYMQICTLTAYTQEVSSLELILQFSVSCLYINILLAAWKHQQEVACGHQYIAGSQVQWELFVCYIWLSRLAAWNI